MIAHTSSLAGSPAVTPVAYIFWFVVVLTMFTAVDLWRFNRRFDKARAAAGVDGPGWTS